MLWISVYHLYFSVVSLTASGLLVSALNILDIHDSIKESIVPFHLLLFPEVFTCVTNIDGDCFVFHQEVRTSAGQILTTIA